MSIQKHPNVYLPQMIRSNENFKLRSVYSQSFHIDFFFRPSPLGFRECMTRIIATIGSCSKAPRRIGEPNHSEFVCSFSFVSWFCLLALSCCCFGGSIVAGRSHGLDCTAASGSAAKSAPMARFGGVMIRQLQFVYGGFCSCCLLCFLV